MNEVLLLSVLLTHLFVSKTCITYLYFLQRSTSFWLLDKNYSLYVKNIKV